MSKRAAAAFGRRPPDLSQAYPWCARLFSIAAVVTLGLLYLPTGQVPLSWVLLAFACICAAAITAWRFPRRIARGTSRWILAWLGTVFFIAAAASDIAATLWHSSTLDEEANLLVRPMLARVPLAWVLVGAGVFQVAFVSLSVSLWQNLLARWPWYLGEVRARGRVPLWLAMLGVRPGGWSRWLMLGKHVDLGLAAFAFYLPWAYAGRVYLAMEWMGWVPISRWVMPCALLVVAFVVQWWVVRRACAGADADADADG